MTSRLERRVAWITGGGRGIGRSIALAYAAEGARVAVSSRTRAQLDSVVDEIAELGGTGLAVTADAMSIDDTITAVQTIEAELGPIDVLVNNAGGGPPPRRDPELSPAHNEALAFADAVDMNLFSAYRATMAVLPGMRERAYGRVINIGSGYAKRSGGDPAYSAAKHGMVGMTRAMAAQVATEGVSINCLCPGWTNTQLVNLDFAAKRWNTTAEGALAKIESDNLQNRMLEPDELGPMAVLLACDDARSITGQVISVDGGYGV